MSGPRAAILCLHSLFASFAVFSTSVATDISLLDFGKVHGQIRAPDLINYGPKIEAVNGIADTEALPFTHQHEKRVGSGGPYWMSQIKRQGRIGYGTNATYTIWRNVKDYGAKGDGITDDTAAIQRATAEGGRCGLGCESSTTSPGIVYFPPGTYMISSAIIMYYYSQFIGDANDWPILKATKEFDDIGVLDSDDYLAGGASWWGNTNNFFRQVRNFVY